MANESGIPDEAWDKFMAENPPVTEETPAGDDPTPEVDPVTPAPTPEAPAAPVEPEKPAEPAEPEVDPIDAMLEEISADIKVANQKIDAMAKPEPKAPAEPTISPALKALLEHEDPTVREGAREILARQEESASRLQALEEKNTVREIEAEAAIVNAEIVAAAKQYSLTKEQVEQVADYLESDPNLASTLSFEEGTLRVFPELKRRTEPTPKDPAPGDKSGKPTVVKVPAREVGATVLDRASATGTVPKPERVPDGENMEQAVARGSIKLLGA